MSVRSSWLDSDTPTSTPSPQKPSPAATTSFLTPETVNKMRTNRASLTPLSSTPRPDGPPETPLLAPRYQISTATKSVIAMESSDDEDVTPRLTSPPESTLVLTKISEEKLKAMKELPPTASPSTPYFQKARKDSSASHSPAQPKNQLIFVPISKPSLSPRLQRTPAFKVSNESDKSVNRSTPSPVSDLPTFTGTPIKSSDLLLRSTNMMKKTEEIKERLDKLMAKEQLASPPKSTTPLLMKKRMRAPSSPLLPNEPYLDPKKKEALLKERRKSDSPQKSHLKYAVLNNFTPLAMRTDPNSKPELNVTPMKDNYDSDEDPSRSIDIPDTILTPLASKSAEIVAKEDVSSIKDRVMTAMKEIFDQDFKAKVKAAWSLELLECQLWRVTKDKEILMKVLIEWTESNYIESFEIEGERYWRLR